MRYSHADWAREQQAEHACHAVMRYIVFGRPPSLPNDVLSCIPSHQRPSFSEIQELAPKCWLHATEEVSFCSLTDSATPVRLAAPGGTRGLFFFNDEPARIYVPLLMRPWVMKACHSTASCHLGTTRTLRMPERFTGRLV